MITNIKGGSMTCTMRKLKKKCKLLLILCNAMQHVCISECVFHLSPANIIFCFSQCITRATAGTRNLLSATESMNRAFTSATTRAPNSQIPWLNIQAQDDDDDEEDIGQQSVDESEARSTTDKPKISSDFIRPGSVDKVFPPPA